MGGLLLVGLSRSIVLVLLGLVLEGVDTSLGTARLSVDLWEEEVMLGLNIPVANADVGVLSNLLVGLLGSLVGGALDLVCGGGSVMLLRKGMRGGGGKSYRRRS